MLIKHDLSDRRFDGIGFEDFAHMANDQSLSPNEKIGFPDRYRDGFVDAIYGDLCVKLPALTRSGVTIADVGPGCSELPRRFHDRALHLDQRLIWIDSAPMLAQLPDQGVEKLAARFPEGCIDWCSRHAGMLDVLIAYSVLQYVFAEGNIWAFLDQALSLLAPGGAMLLGDIPNVSKRKRFLSTVAGETFHRAFMGVDEPPQVHYSVPEPGLIDDAVLLGLVARARAAGFDAYLMPQPPTLPMANRREDLLITHP